MGVGKIKISLHFTRTNMLHVPKLCTNFTSLNKLSHDVNCKVIYIFFSHCEFHDQTLGRMIEYVEVWNKLYFLDTLEMPHSTFFY